ncbi:MAG: L,D-transpeptidase family protein [Chitinophagales bacterium]|nr:L,D-transpeptidase family protein [Bacteroidota bacterium]MCB9043150.1 L,D-transpeptidase family protein [Chitinophagales bacterium]
MRTTTRIVFWTTIVSIIGLTLYYFYPEQKLPADKKIDTIVVFKSKRKLLAYAGNQLLKTYTISLGAAPAGHKEYEGDNKTPEGTYTIYDKNPHSTCHKNLGISYPNKADIAHAKKIGKPAGGAIKIHGISNGLGFIGKFHRWFDWTSGCIALTDQEMDELYYAVKIGAKIEIKP